MVKRLSILGMLLFLSCMPSRADELTVVTANLSPFTIAPDKHKPGFLHEIVAEMSKRSGIKLNIEYLPWKRAQIKAQKTKDTLIFGITRTKRREPKYTWLVNLLNTEKVFVSKYNVINSLDEAKNVKRITVRFATPFEKILASEGFKNITKSHSEKDNALKLHRNRAEAWFTLSHRAEFIWKSMGYDTKVLKIGKPHSKTKLFLAGNHSLANKPEIKNKLQTAYKDIVTDGTFDKLHVKYFGRASR